MQTYTANVTVMPKTGVLDIQGKAVERTLKNNGYGHVDGVRVGKFIRLDVKADDESAAAKLVEAVASDLLSNDLIEDFSYTLELASR